MLIAALSRELEYLFNYLLARYAKPQTGAFLIVFAHAANL